MKYFLFTGNISQLDYHSTGLFGPDEVHQTARSILTNNAGLDARRPIGIGDPLPSERGPVRRVVVRHKHTIVTLPQCETKYQRDGIPRPTSRIVQLTPVGGLGITVQIKGTAPVRHPGTHPIINLPTKGGPKETEDDRHDNQTDQNIFV